MLLTLKREILADKYTEGKLYIDGEYFCDTLEDTVRDLNRNGKFDDGEKKIKGDTAIPYGEYTVRVTYSPKFKRLMPLICNVSEFIGIRMHFGRTVKNTEGCTLIGLKENDGELSLSEESKNKIVKLTALLLATQNKGEEIKIKIV